MHTAQANRSKSFCSFSTLIVNKDENNEMWELLELKMLSDFSNFTILSDLFTWKNSQLACWRWSSLHAAHDDQKGGRLLQKRYALTLTLQRIYYRHTWTLCHCPKEDQESLFRNYCYFGCVYKDMNMMGKGLC